MRAALPRPMSSQGGDDDNEDDINMDDNHQDMSGSRICMIAGSLRNRPARALHLRQSFLFGKPSYLLYFWEVMVLINFCSHRYSV